MTEEDLITDIREMTSATEALLPVTKMTSVLRRSKRHIRIRTGIEADIDWYDPTVPEREEALFWVACLFSKVALGDLDSQDLQIGALDHHALLAVEDDEVTTWFRNAESALRSIESAETMFPMTSPIRDGRVYGEDSETGGSAGFTTDI